jgi:hypothetical protein
MMKKLLLYLPKYQSKKIIFKIIIQRIKAQIFKIVTKVEAFLKVKGRLVNKKLIRWQIIL